MSMDYVKADCVSASKETKTRMADGHAGFCS